MANNISHFSAFWKGWVPGSLEVEGFLCISCFSYCSWWIIERGSDWGVGRGRAGVSTRPAAPGTQAGRWHEQTGLSSCHLCTLGFFFHHPGGGRLCLQYQWLNGTPFVTFAIGLKVWLSKAALSDRANYLLLGFMPVIWVAPWWMVLSGCVCIIQRVRLPPGRERKPRNSLNADKCASSLRDTFIHRVKYVISNYLGWVLLNINEYNSNWEEIERFVSHCCAFLL